MVSSKVGENQGNCGIIIKIKIMSGDRGVVV
jgi:hypothetical protein